MSLADVLNGLKPGLHVAGAARIGIDQVCIDSRQASPGCLFFALAGERVDGHAYVQDAFRAGAVAAVVSEPVLASCVVDTTSGVYAETVEQPVAVIVLDTLVALQRLAAARRRSRRGLRVIGVTGSLGKTTTKEAIAHVLGQRYGTLKNSGNQNNEIGLPLTLLNLEAHHQRAVLEMGMYALGEIALLAEVAAPQVGVVTNVGPSHLERLGTLERIAQAKSELVAALPDDGVAVLNGDDPRVSVMGRLTRARAVTFGLGRENTVRADSIVGKGLAGVELRVHARGPFAEHLTSATRVLETGMLGEHAAQTVLAAVAVALVEGLGWEEIQRGLDRHGAGIRLVPKRGRRGEVILDDSYNASPASVIAAMRALADLPGRHLAVLGDMLELGEHERSGHLAVGREAAQRLDALVTVGVRARDIAGAALEAGMPSTGVHVLEDGAEAIELLRGLLREADTLLVKGSRGMRMEAIVEALEERD